MASKLTFKVYHPTHGLIGATRFVEDAAALVAANGDGTKIKRGGRIVWKEGKEIQSAAESYDFVAKTIDTREFRFHAEYLAKYAPHLLTIAHASVLAQKAV